MNIFIKSYFVCSILFANSICLAKSNHSFPDSLMNKQTQGSIAILDSKVSNLQKSLDTMNSRNLAQINVNKPNSIQITTLVITSLNVLFIIFGFLFTLFEFTKSNKTKKCEFIDNLYKEFNDKDIMLFFNVMDKALDIGDDIAYIKSLENKIDTYPYFEIGRDKALAFVDKLYYFRENGLLSLHEFEYFAYEIITLTKSNYITQYLKKYHESIKARKPEYKVDKLHKIFPFTGIIFFKEYRVKGKTFEDEINYYCKTFESDTDKQKNIKTSRLS